MTEHCGVSWFVEAVLEGVRPTIRETALLRAENIKKEGARL